MAPFAALSLATLSLLSSVSSASPSHQHRSDSESHQKRAYATPVDVAGVHTWQAPTTGDQRGPCPALNALANHGYLSRDGVVTPAHVITAINSVFGMGLDLATILATMGVVFAGAPVSLAPEFSIAGQDKAVDNLLNGVLGLTGMPQGLNLSHNTIEADSSPTRDDLYETGDAWTMNMDKFQELLAIVPKGGSLEDTSGPMSAFAAQRLQESVASNPYFFYGPTLLIVGPDEVLLKSFFGVTGSGSSMSYSYGHERIPDNWYKTASDYTLVDLNLDLVSWITSHPELADIGGNTGTVNSFTGVDLDNLTSGVLNAATLLEDNNLICFALNVVKLAAPSYTNKLFATLSGPLNLILNAVNVPMLSLDCPTWAALQSGGQNIFDVLSEYQIPGASEGLI
ncbi:hypothetical protein LTR08_001706 [Meristemomyces frigidus]|nr:hypothetical protein LTR08_001706 [Meristemomyces frigidus]